MNYCTNCGKEMDPAADVCLNCGKSRFSLRSTSSQPDTGGFGWGLLGFCIPVAGLILYLVWLNERPMTAKAVGTGALTSVILIMLFYFFLFIVALSF